MIRNFLIGIVIYVVFSFQVIASEDKALFWRVNSQQSTVYLLGSVHFADDSFYPLRPEIEQAFDSSETLVVEIDINSPNTVSNYQNIMKSEGLYPGDETLKDNLSAETYNQLQGYLKKLNIPSELIEKKKPGIVVLTLAAIQMRNLGLNSEKGIDIHFLKRALGSRAVLGLETMEDQLRIFLDIDDADLLLKNLFHSLDMVEEDISTLINAWKRGDEKLMQQLLFDDMLNENAEIISLYESLYFQRNIKMTASIKRYLKGKGKYFVVVGAGHLVGDRGIVRLLQQAGYSVTRL